MPGLIPDQIIDQILDRCDIVEIISSYVPLKRAGRNYKGSCPFHHEKTPSFMVNPEKGIFHCFGCGVGGNAISFIMKYERLEFLEVIKMLAKKAGVELPQRQRPQSSETSSIINILYRIHDYAAAYFQNTLASAQGKEAAEYLKNRGLEQATVSKFRLGYAADSWEGLLAYLRKANFRDEHILKAGLIIPRTDGQGHYDRFRKRLIFPIFNHRDKIIAFAGRVLDESLPKYMNSPETPIYSKSHTLFGLNFSRKPISEKDMSVIVEGYMDFIIPYQAGVQNIVASCGTALTAEHVRMLKRLSTNITMVYDPDKAGEMATLRGLDLLLSEDMHVKIARLPKGLDPDSFVRKNGPEALSGLLSASMGLIEYKLEVLKATYGSESAESRARIAGEMLGTISRIGNAILKSEYIKLLADRLKMDEAALRSELKKVKNYDERRAPASQQTMPAGDTQLLPAADKIIIGTMLEDNSTIPLVKAQLTPDEFENNSTRRIIELIYSTHEQNRPVTCASIISHLELEGIDDVLSDIAATHTTCGDKAKGLNDCIWWVKKNNFKAKISELNDEIKKTQDTGQQNTLRELVARYNRLLKECCQLGAQSRV